MCINWFRSASIWDPPISIYLLIFCIFKHLPTPLKKKKTGSLDAPRLDARAVAPLAPPLHATGATKSLSRCLLWCAVNVPELAKKELDDQKLINVYLSKGVQYVH